MFGNFLIAIQAILPIFVMMGIGMSIHKLGLMTTEEARRLNQLVFKVFFFAMLFNNVYKNDVGDVIKPKLMVFGGAGILFIYVLATLFVLKTESSNRTRGAMIHAIYRSNFVIIGMPLAMNICGAESAGVTAMMIAVIVPLYNILAVITLEVYRGEKPNPIHIIRELIKNPMLDGAILGMLCVLFNIRLPGFVEEIFDDLTACATPLALIILGVSFELKALKSTGKNLIITVLGRLVVVPGIMLTLAALVGFRGAEFVTLLGIFAAPCAVASYTMAVSMDSDYELAGSAVVVSSMLSCFTMFFWILLFKTLGLF